MRVTHDPWAGRDKAVRRHRVQMLSFVGFWMCAGCAILFVNTFAYGLGVGPDGVKYLAAAGHLAKSGEFGDEIGNLVTDAPPLYPFLVSIGIRASLLPLSSVFVVHYLALGILIALVANWSHGSLVSPIARNALMLGVVLSPALATVSSRILSDLPFATITFAFLLASAVYLRSGGAAALAQMTVWSSAAALTRYIGIAEIVTGGVIVLLAHQASPFARLGRAAVFVAAASAPLALWCLRNWTIDETIFGPRAATSETLVGIVNALRWTLSTWFAGHAPAVLVASVAVAYCTLLAIRRSPRAWIANRLSLTSAVFVAIYLGLLSAAAAITNIDALDQRLLSPIYIPSLCIVMTAIDCPARPGLSAATSWQESALKVGLAGWLLLLAHQSLNFAQSSISAGHVGYSSKLWRESELAKHANLLPLSAKLFSNVPWAFSYITGRAVFQAPTQGSYRSSDKLLQKGTLLPDWPGQEAYLLWSDRNAPPYFVRIERLRNQYPMQRVGKYSDGEIFLIMPP